MREATVKLYAFDELDEVARRRAVERHRDFLNESGILVEGVSELLKIDLGLWGIVDASGGPLPIEWSLGYCQGDGVAFYGRVDPLRLYGAIGAILAGTAFGGFPTGSIARVMVQIRDDLDTLSKIHDFDGDPIRPEFLIERNSYGRHYSHAETMDVSVECPEPYVDEVREEVRPIWKRLDENFREYVRHVSRALTRTGYAELDYRQGEEAIREDCEANEYEFLEDGTLAPHFIRGE